MTYRTKLTNYFSRRDRGWLLSLFAAACLVYLPFLGTPFFFDDLNFFTTGAAEAYKYNGFDLPLRWLPYASLAWIAAVFSDELPHIYHLCNLLLHIANTILLFFFLRHLLGAVLAKGNETSNVVRGAWFGALVFALHPVLVYAVGYAIQFSILMATLFVLLMQLAYLRGLLSGQKRWFALAVLAYFMACFSKEHSVLMPAVLGAMSLLVRGENRIQWRVLWMTWGAFFAIAVLVTLRSRGVFGNPYEPMAAQLFAQQGIEINAPLLHLLSALTQAGLFFKYLLLWVLPDPSLLSVDMRESFITSPFALQAWFGGVAFVLYGVFGIRLLLRGGMSGLAGFAMLYPWLLFWVELTGIRIQEPFVLYRSYLWMPGMMLLIPLLMLKLSERNAILAMIGLVLVLVPLSWGRLSVFGDGYRMWNEAAALLKNGREAGADRIFYNRWQAEMAAEKWDAAAADFKRSAEISPGLAPIRYMLGLAYGNAGRYEESLVQFDVAIALDPNDAKTYYSKAMTLMRLHRNEEAKQYMKKSCELKSTFACLVISGKSAIPDEIKK